MRCTKSIPRAFSLRTRHLPKLRFSYTTKWLRLPSIRASSFSFAKKLRMEEKKPLCRSEAIWARIEKKLPNFGHNCLTKGLKYSNIMPAEADLSSGMVRGWQSTLSIDSRKKAEARLSELEYS